MRWVLENWIALVGIVVLGLVVLYCEIRNRGKRG
jgi:hypothetical protein